MKHGWLSPDGIFFDSYFLLTHFEKAEEIIEWEHILYKGKDPLTNKKPWCAERILEILGWIKVGSCEGYEGMENFYDKITEKQAEFLVQYKY